MKRIRRGGSTNPSLKRRSSFFFDYFFADFFVSYIYISIGVVFMFSKMNGWFHRRFFLEDFFLVKLFWGGTGKTMNFCQFP